MTRTHLGIIYMLTAQALYVTIDGLIQLLEHDYSIHELVFTRNVFSMLPLLIYGLLQKGPRIEFKLVHFKANLSRAIATILGFYFILEALVLGSLQEVISIAFSVVFFVCIFSYLILQEQIDGKRWLAILIGFIGVLIAARPSLKFLNLASLFAFLYSTFDAFTMVRGKQLSQHYSTSAMLVYNNLLACLLSSICLGVAYLAPIQHRVPVWRTPSGSDILIFIATGLGGLVAQCLVTQAYSKARASVVSPMIYSSMVWAPLFSYLVWQQVPHPQLVLGSSIIMLSGLYIINSTFKHPSTPVQQVST